MFILKISEVIICILMIILIITQSKGVGLSATFGGSEFHSSRRGAEKVFFTVTIILAILFVVFSILNLIIK